MQDEIMSFEMNKKDKSIPCFLDAEFINVIEPRIISKKLDYPNFIVRVKAENKS